MKRKLFVVLLAAVLLGAGFGYLGALIDHYNHTSFGTSYSQWRLQWLAFPSLPGEVIAELRSGYDWGADEMWLYRHVVTVSNALFWSVLALFSMVSPLLRALSLNLHRLRPSGGIDSDEY